MKAYQELVKEALRLEFTIDLYSEDGLELENSENYQEVIDLIENLDDLPVLRFHDKDGCYRGFAQVNLFVNDDESVMDHSINYTVSSVNPKNSDKWINDWFQRVVMA